MFRITMFLIAGLIAVALLYVGFTDAQVAPVNVVSSTRLKTLPTPGLNQKYVFHIRKRGHGSHKTSIEAELPDGSIKTIATCTGDCTFSFPAETMNPITKKMEKHTLKRIKIKREKCRRCDVVADWEIK